MKNLVGPFPSFESLSIWLMKKILSWTVPIDQQNRHLDSYYLTIKSTSMNYPSKHSQIFVMVTCHNFFMLEGIGNVPYRQISLYPTSPPLGFPWKLKLQINRARITGNSAANDEGRALAARWRAEKCHGGIPYYVSHLLISEPGHQVAN